MRKDETIMKNMKKIFALLITMVMILGMSVSVFAAEPETTTGSITINPGSDATGTVSTSYEYFELMKASIDGDKVAYYVDSPASDTLAGLLDAVTVDGADLFNVTKSGDGSRWNIVINKKADDSEYTDTDGAAIAAALNTVAIKEAAIAHNTFVQSNGSAKAENLEKGYYLVTSTLGKELVLQTLNDVTIETKNDYPTLGKTASKTNMEVGDIVTYTVTVNIPTTTKVGETFTVHDTIDAHLALLNASDKIAASAADYAITAVIGDTTTAVTLTDGTLKSGETFAKSFTATQAMITAGSVVFTYKAELLSTAADDTGYVNKAYVNTPAYESLPVDVPVYTFEFDLDKEFTGATDAEASDFEATFKLVDSAGNQITFVKSGNKYEFADSDDQTTEDVLTVTGADAINVVGVAAGTYTLTELTTADGYNLLTDAITVTITDTTDTTADPISPSHTIKYKIDDKEFTPETNTVTVENKAGKVLPSTGGTGTTVFYVIGAVLVIAAGILLVTRRRMNSK